VPTTPSLSNFLLKKLEKMWSTENICILSHISCNLKNLLFTKGNPLTTVAALFSDRSQLFFFSSHSVNDLSMNLSLVLNQNILLDQSVRELIKNNP